MKTLNLFDVFETNFDWRFSPEDRQGDYHHTVFRSDLGDFTDRTLKRTVHYLDAFTQFSIDLELSGTDSEFAYFFVRQRNRLGSGPYKARHTAGIANDIPGIIVHDHIDQNINNSPDAVLSPVTGISWNLAPIQDQIDQSKSIYDEYTSMLVLADDFEATYNEMIEKLKMAGAEDILTEITAQYNAYIAG